KYAFRQLQRSPGFTLTAVIILGLGIGFSTAIFSAINPVLFEPLPYPHADRILMIWYANVGGGRAPQTFHTFREVAERNRSFESLAVMKQWQPTVTGEAQPERLDGQRVSASYFRVLGILPVLGRDFQAADDVPNAPRVVILSNRVWHRRFGGGSEIVGRQ